MLKSLLLILMFNVGCVEDHGLFTHTSCIPYEKYIYEAVDRFNEMEGDEIIVVEGRLDHPYRSRQENIADDYDLVYCVYPWVEGKTGAASRHRGDVYLFPRSFWDISIFRCVVLHELGHRYLGLWDNDDPDTIMGGMNKSTCWEKTEWE